MFKSILNWIRGDKEENSQEDLTGKVSYLNYKRGFGFIQSPHVDDKIFVHFTDARDKLRKGSTVKFKLDKTNKGYRAINVLVAE